MAGETYAQIKKAKEELEREQRERNTEAARQASVRNAEEAFRNAEESKKRIKNSQEIEANASRIYSIFQEIMDNETQVRFSHKKTISVDKTKYDGSNVTSADLELKWGDKFTLTSAESEIIRKHKYKGLHLSTQLPETIVSADYYHIEAHVDHASVSIAGARFNPEEFKLNPTITSQALARALLNPPRVFRTLTKGYDYFVPRSNASDPIKSQGPF